MLGAAATPSSTTGARVRLEVGDRLGGGAGFASGLTSTLLAGTPWSAEKEGALSTEAGPQPARGDTGISAAAVLSRLRSAGVLPVVELPSPDVAVPLAETLRGAGLEVIEFTFRTDGAAEAIAAVRRACPDVLVGAGTVLTLAQLEAAIDSGARFIASPGFSPLIVERSLAAQVLPLPGVCTPTEILMALEAGLEALKFFPAEQAGGVAYLRSLAGPFRTTRFVPTGGISAANLGDYLAVPSVLACGGTWFVLKELLAAGDFATVARLASEAVRVVKEVRGDARG